MVSASIVRCLLLVLVSVSLCAYGDMDASLSNEVAVPPTFAEYVKKFDKTYGAGSAEYSMRRKLYKARVRENAIHNRNADRIWNAGVNIMSDRTQAEIDAFNGYRRLGRGSSREGNSLIAVSDDPNEDELGYAMPTDFSWASADTDGDEKQELVKTFQNPRSQSCGNCWACTANTVMEAHRQIHGGVVAHFDDDELTQCSENFFHCGGGGGCDGSTVELALMHYAKNGCFNHPDHPNNATFSTPGKPSCPKLHDIVNKNELPPHEIKDGIRQLPKDSPGQAFGMIGWERLPSNKGLPLMMAVYERGPLGIAIATDGLHRYESGVFAGCSKDAVLGHAVTLFGFGQVQHNGKLVKYWTLQNSWGSSFGENGHFRLLRHDRDDEYCGIDRKPKEGSGCDGGPQAVTVCGMCGLLYETVLPYSVPSTWLAKQLEHRRNRREAFTLKRAGKHGGQHILSVDEYGAVAASKDEVNSDRTHLAWILKHVLISAVVALLFGWGSYYVFRSVRNGPAQPRASGYFSKNV